MSEPEDVPDGLLDAFWAYERALMADDVPTLDRLFAPGPTTLRGDANGLLVGHDAIAAFRSGRGGAAPRRIVETHVQVVDDDHALVVAVTERERGGRGQQTQLWRRGEQGWQVTAAHVSAPAPALDRRIWRVVGDPLVGRAAEGKLSSETVAVKDLYAVAGLPVGAGNPTWLAHASPEPTHAWAVRTLLEAGADLVGISRTDEFAYSLAGTNAHYGTPPNPRAAYRIPGGSSSGSASAVALGQASVGLGTDTGGSIRVPAAYQGLWGIRTSHDLLPRDGLLPLAPTFDTVGWLTRDAETLRAVGDVLLPPGYDDPAADLVVVPDLVALAEPDVADAVTVWADTRAAAPDGLDVSVLPGWLTAFQRLQAREAWQQHGPWLRERMESLGEDVRGRFETGSRVTDEAADAAREVVSAARRTVRAFVGDRVLVLPSASSVAPRPGPEARGVRDATMRLTCLAGIGGLPAVSVPLVTNAGLPCGACLVGAPGRDRALLALAAHL